MSRFFQPFSFLLRIKNRAKLFLPFVVAAASLCEYSLLTQAIMRAYCVISALNFLTGEGVKLEILRFLLLTTLMKIPFMIKAMMKVTTNQSKN